jgi:GGDEF domain-containing protein
MALMFLISLVLPTGAALVVAALVIGGACAVALELHTREVANIAQSNRAINSLLEKQVQPGRRLVIIDPETTMLKRWYFDLRLSEEVSRCRRYGSSLAVIAVRRLAGAGVDARTQTEVDFVKVFTRNVRSLDLAAKLGDQDYCICLPHTDKSGAEAVATRLLAEVGDGQVIVGVAEFDPQEKEGDVLIERAFSHAMPSSSFTPAPKLERRRSEYRELLERVSREQSGSVALGPDETPNGVKARLRRAAKSAGVALRLSDGDGAVYFERQPLRERQSQVA